MKKFIIKKNSIFLKLFIPMIIVMLIQAFIFGGSIFWGGMFSQLEDNSYNLLEVSVTNRKEYFEGFMTERWSNLSEQVDSINEKVKARLSNDFDRLLDINLASAVLNDCIEPTLSILERNFVTGAFVILMGENLGAPQGKNANERFGLYVRDANPNRSATDLKDLSVECAPKSVSQELNKKGITISSSYQPNFSFPVDINAPEFDFIKKPFSAISTGKLYDELGYWSSMFVFTNKNIPVMTYTIPLAIDGVHYGVIGIDVDAAYLSLLLPTAELSEKNEGAYVLGIDNAGDMDFDVVTSGGQIFSRLVSDTSKVSFKADKKIRKTIFNVSNLKSSDEAVGSVHYLHLYNVDSPFIGDKWAVIGLVQNKNLLAFNSKIETIIIIAIASSSGCVLAAIIFVTVWLTRPISRLIKKIKTQKNKSELKLGKTNIYEIDELISSIEQLSREISETADKMSGIIKISGMAVGAYEIDCDKNAVFYTDQFFKLLGLGNICAGISSEQFNEIMSDYEKNFQYEDDEHTYRMYRYEIEDEIHWVKIKTLINREKIMGVCEDVTKQINEKQKIERERDYDILTNLLNRRAFVSKVKQLFTSPETIKNGAFIMMDLDNLKFINDTYGHDGGDKYIAAAASILAKFASDNVIVGRMAGDEFFVFLYGYEKVEDISRVISRIQTGFANSKLQLENATLKVRTSAGVAWYPRDSRDFEELVRYADFAMYEIKNNKKGEFNDFNLGQYNNGIFVLQNKEELNKLIDEQLVTYHYQPIVDVRTGKEIGFEALMRSISPAFHSPGEILKVAKAQSKLNSIEILTWTKCLEEYISAGWDLKNRKIFINSIPNQSLTDEFVGEFEKKYSQILSKIVIEITESEQLDERFTQRKKHYTSKWGSEIALDDFGSGYNGDNTLLSLEPNYVKTDMNMLRNIHKDLKRQNLLANLTNYAREHGMKVIAEGVETLEELEAVINLGCDFVQGYYIAKPSAVPEGIDEDIRKEIVKLYKNYKKSGR